MMVRGVKTLYVLVLIVSFSFIHMRKIKDHKSINKIKLLFFPKSLEVHYISYYVNTEISETH